MAFIESGKKQALPYAEPVQDFGRFFSFLSDW
jgi:hypothetical protein